MQRYFIKNDQLIDDDQAIIIGDDVHHIRDVMRFSVGDRIILCTYDKRSFLAEITYLNRMEIAAKVVEEKAENVELPIFVTISQGITKGDKFDLVVQMATECGASDFVAVAMKRSVAKIDEKKTQKKVERWQRIALAAARQSHRQIVPSIKMPVDLKGLVAMACEYDVCIFAYEMRAQTSDLRPQNVLADVIRKFKPRMRVLVLIGPEGGIDESEAHILIEAGFKEVGLGPRILRTETAPIYVMSTISYALEIEGIDNG